MPLSITYFKLKSLAIACLTGSLFPALCAMEKPNERIESPSSDTIVIQTKQEKLRDQYTFCLDLAKENPDIKLSDGCSSNVMYSESIIYQSENLISIPQSIGKLGGLTNNKLKRLPEEIGFLSNLTSLNVGENQLEELPPSFENLTNLIELNIYGNKFNTLPKHIYQMKKLRSICISKNQLSDISQLVTLTELTTLSLGDNLVETVPEDIGKLTKLTHLCLSNNKIKKLPRSICHLSSLRGLYLENNKLIQLPLEFYKLPQLFYLNLENNDQLGRHAGSFSSDPQSCTYKSTSIRPLFTFYEQLHIRVEETLVKFLTFKCGDRCLETNGTDFLLPEIVLIIQRFLIELLDVNSR